MPVSRVVFSTRQKDDWETPATLFAALDAEFLFTCDAAANAANTKCRRYFGPDSPWVPDALAVSWSIRHYFLNPPYSQTRAFLRKAAEAAANGSLVVCLVAARTCTRWWHESVYDSAHWQYRPGVEVRFLRGRLRFVGATNSAPFPSAVVIFRPSWERTTVTGEQDTTPCELERATTIVTRDPPWSHAGPPAPGRRSGREVEMRDVLTAPRRSGMSPTVPYDDLPEFLSPEEFGAYLRLGRNTVYDLLRRDAVPHVRFGRTIRIPKTALQQPQPLK